MPIIVPKKRFLPTKYSLETGDGRSRWGSAKDKYEFVKQFVSFVEADFPLRLFEVEFYYHLTGMFAMFAHYSRERFYNDFFTNLKNKREFISQCVSFIPRGDPNIGCSDVEECLIEWLKENQILHKIDCRIAAVEEIHDQAEYARLKAKYET